MPGSNLPLDADRLWADIMSLAEITDPARPYTRRSFSNLFLDGRAWLERKFSEAGLTTHIDPAGNLIGRLEGRKPALGVIAVGSHSDTVPSGGRFDGIAGVVAGLEVVRALRDADIRLDHTIEVVDFLAEEPSEYGLSCVGSRGIAGALDPKMLNMKAPHGEVLGQALRRVGGDPVGLADAKRVDLCAFLELHIEQGSVLESRSVPVGVVTSIVGIRRLEIIYEGRADHAGTTPMHLRRDALTAAADTAIRVRDLAEGLDGKGSEYFVATVGILDVQPSASNVVPGKCRLVVDIRSTCTELVKTFTQVIDTATQDFAQQARVERTSFATLSDGPPVACDELLQNVLGAAADRLGVEHMRLPSGAGHDAAFMSRICRSAMVFVPCRDGISHAPHEWADKDAIALGTGVLVEAIKALDAELQ